MAADVLQLSGNAEKSHPCQVFSSCCWCCSIANAITRPSKEAVIVLYDLCASIPVRIEVSVVCSPGRILH